MLIHKLLLLYYYYYHFVEMELFEHFNDQIIFFS
jgi:hypothetical protein